MKRATGLGASAAKSAANASGSTARKPSPTGPTLLAAAGILSLRSATLSPTSGSKAATKTRALTLACVPHFVDDHPAIAVADQHTRTCLVEHAARRSHVCRETRLRLLDNSYRVTVALENVRHRLPSGAISEGAVDQNDSLDGRVRRG